MRLLTFAARASLSLNSYTNLVLLELKVPEGVGWGLGVGANLLSCVMNEGPKVHGDLPKVTEPRFSRAGFCGSKTRLGPVAPRGLGVI